MHLCIINENYADFIIPLANNYTFNIKKKKKSEIVS